MKVLLGEGILNWPRGERVTDRYGAVNLSSSGEDDYIEMDAGWDHIGKRGRLTAKVIETRESYHIGDLARGIIPSKPEVDAEMVLGEGELFYGDYGSVGLKPEDHRASDWLDPEVLYKLHGQTVELYFEAKDAI